MLTETDNKIGPAIARTMQYYAFFSYPLQVHEIRQYCGVACSNRDVLSYLSEQKLQGKLYNLDGFYSLIPDVAALLQRRLKGTVKAGTDLIAAQRVGRLIYQFPFVIYVGISGSLSKGYSDSRSDFDFFIVTKKDRLWISRTLLHILKKLTFIIGQQHKFCMNYFIDETALRLEERNIYTATELSSLIPVCGAAIHQQLMQANAWTRTLLPNYIRKEVGALGEKSGFFKTLLASVITVMHPTGMNRILMKITDIKWRKKWARKGYPSEDYELAFKTRINISKNHRANYQKKILEALKQKDE